MNIHNGNAMPAAVSTTDYDKGYDSIQPTSAVYKLNERFIVQLADKEDLPAILAIYNQSIAGKQATANLTPVTCAERQGWFDEHINSATRPIYIVKATDAGADRGAEQTVSPIVAWGSFSDLYTRPAYHISTEISIYLHQEHHGQGLGSFLTRWMLTQAPSLGLLVVDIKPLLMAIDAGERKVPEDIQKLLLTKIEHRKVFLNLVTNQIEEFCN